jgi:hypothetical protein
VVVALGAVDDVVLSTLVDVEAVALLESSDDEQPAATRNPAAIVATQINLIWRATCMPLP